MKRIVKNLGGLGLGAALMYILDPQRGKARRTKIREQLVGGVNKATELYQLASDGMKKRTQDIIDKGRLQLEASSASDGILTARVRSELGRICQNPSAIQVIAEQGRITLLGAANLEEIDEITKRIESVQGVALVRNQLQSNLPPTS